MAGKKSPGLWIETGVDGKICAFMVDLAAETLMLPSMLQEIDPLGFFEVDWFLDQALWMKDDGSALFLLRAGRQVAADSGNSYPYTISGTSWR